MVKKLILAISVLVNLAFIYVIFRPVNAAGVMDRMTCNQARSDKENKNAVEEFAQRHNSSLAEVHEYLRNSGYELRNIAVADGKATFVYTSSAFNPSACGIHLPGIDGGIVRIETGAFSELKVRAVW